MIPFMGALDFFLGFWEVLPGAVKSFVVMCFTLVLAIAIVRAVFDL